MKKVKACLKELENCSLKDYNTVMAQILAIEKKRFGRVPAICSEIKGTERKLPDYRIDEIVFRKID